MKLILFITTLLLCSLFTNSYVYQADKIGGSVIEVGSLHGTTATGMLRRNTFMNCIVDDICIFSDTTTNNMALTDTSGTAEFQVNSKLDTFGFTEDASKLVIVTVETSDDGKATIQEFSVGDFQLITTYQVNIGVGNTATKIKISENGKIVAIETDSNQIYIASSPFGNDWMVINNDLAEGFEDFYFFDDDTKIAIFEVNSNVDNNINPQIKVYDLTTKALLQKINLRYNPKILACSALKNMCVISDDALVFKVDLISGIQDWEYVLASMTQLSISNDGLRIIASVGTASVSLDNEGNELSTFTGLDLPSLINEVSDTLNNDVLYYDKANTKLIRWVECQGFFDNDTDSDNPVCKTCEQVLTNCAVCPTYNTCTSCVEGYIYNDDSTPVCDSCPTSIDYTITYTNMNSIIIKLDQVFILTQEIELNVFNYEICTIIFQQATLDQFGKNPTCSLTVFGSPEYHQIQVQLSYPSTVPLSGTIPISIVSGLFQIDNCSTVDIDTASQTNTSYAGLSADQKLLPTATIQHKPIYSQCEPIVMSIRDIQNDGKADLSSITWEIQTTDGTAVASTETSAFDDKLILTIPQDVLDSDTQYVMKTTLINVYTKTNIISTSFEIGNKQMATINIQNTQDKLSLKRWENFDINFKIEQVLCDDNIELTEQNIEYKIELMTSDSFSALKTQILQKNTNLLHQFHGSFNLEPYAFLANTIYYLKFSTKLLSTEQLTESFDTLILQIEDSDYITKIQEGNRVVSSSETLQLQADVEDLDVSPTELMQAENFTYTWTCQLDNADGDSCKDNQGTPATIVFQSTEILTLAPEFIASDQVYYFKLVTKKPGSEKTSTDSVYITAKEYVPEELKIGVNISKMFLLKRVNPNELIDIQLDLFDNYEPSDLLYQIQIYYDNENVNTKQFYFNEFQVRISDLFTEFNSSIQNITIRINVTDPAKFISFSKDIELEINTPPSIGNIDITVPEYPASSGSYPRTPLETEFTITATNFEDLNTPLSYKFSYYRSQQDFDNKMNEILITDFQPFNTITTKISSSNDEVNDPKQNILVIQVKDIYGSISQSTQTFEVDDFDVTGTTLSEKIMLLTGDFLTNQIFDPTSTLTQAEKLQTLNIYISEVQENISTIISEQRDALQSVSLLIFDYYLQSTDKNLDISDTLSQIVPLNHIINMIAQIEQSMVAEAKITQNELYLQAIADNTETITVTNADGTTQDITRVKEFDPILLQPTVEIVTNEKIQKLTAFFQQKIQEQADILGQYSNFTDIQNLSEIQSLITKLDNSRLYGTIALDSYDSLYQFMQSSLYREANTPAVTRVLTESAFDLKQTIQELQDITQILVAPLLPNSEGLVKEGLNISYEIKKLNKAEIQQLFQYNKAFLQAADVTAMTADPTLEPQYMANFEANATVQKLYNYELIKINNNPLKNYGDIFYTNDESYPIQILKVTAVQQYNALLGLDITLNPGNTYQLEFTHQYKSGDNIQCIQYVEADDAWTSEFCSAFQRSQDQVICQCSTFNPVTIVNDTKYNYSERISSNQEIFIDNKTTEVEVEIPGENTVTKVPVTVEKVVEKEAQSEEGNFFGSFAFIFFIFQIIATILFAGIGFLQDGKKQKVQSETGSTNLNKIQVQQFDTLPSAHQNYEESRLQTKSNRQSIAQNQKISSPKNIDAKEIVIEQENEDQNQEKKFDAETGSNIEKKNKRKKKKESIITPKEENGIETAADFNLKKQLSQEGSQNILLNANQVKPQINYNQNPKQISIAYTFFLYHQFFSIIAVYRQSLCRANRFLAVFAKYATVYGIMSLIVDGGDDDQDINVLRILSVILCFVFTSVSLFLNLVTQNKSSGVAAAGVAMSIVIYLALAILGIIIGNDMSEVQVVNFGDCYLFGLLIDIFLTQSIFAVVKNYMAISSGKSSGVQTLLGKEVIEKQHFISSRISIY